MTSLVLAFALLLAAGTVDPRLEQPLSILANLRARDPGGDLIGPYYASLPDALKLTLAIGSLPPGAGGHYEPSRRTLTLADVLLAEDPRVLAAGLVHELRHAADFDQIDAGQLTADCIELESRAFVAQAIVTRALWPDELPDGSVWERGLASNVTLYESGGPDAIRDWVGQSIGYQQVCAPRPGGRNGAARLLIGRRADHR
jgi:hypothetical protein